MSTSVAITSIYEQNKVINTIKEYCDKYGWNLVIAGDTISKNMPSSGSLKYMTIAEQIESGFKYAKYAPVRNYCRKNVAYLKSMQLGSERIIETDDDNIPYESFFNINDKNINVKVAKEEQFVNIFKYFTETKNIWPRGFSLADINREITKYEDLPQKQIYCPVQCGLVDADPDVDAIYRLLFTLPFNFEHKDRKIAISKGTWCSFNTQNTVFYKEVFPLMYQPATPMFREADILRSFVVQRILWENNASVLFYSPTVYQERNPHDFILDLREEVKLYGYIKEVVGKLEKLDIKSGSQNFYDNMIKCYEIYKNYGFVTNQEFKLIDCWFEDLQNLKII